MDVVALSKVSSQLLKGTRVNTCCFDVLLYLVPAGCSHLIDFSTLIFSSPPMLMTGHFISFKWF